MACLNKIVNGYTKVELPDAWLSSDGNVWETKKPHAAVDVKIYGNVYLVPQENGDLETCLRKCQTLHAVPYDITQIKHNNDGSKIICVCGMWKFQKYELDYPTHNDDRRIRDITVCCIQMMRRVRVQSLRLIQEYFAVSAGLQTIVTS